MTPRLPPFPTPKPNLVVVRAGGKSLHPPPQDGVQAILIKGGKWDGLFKTFQAFEHHASYERIWLPDDDIATTAADRDHDPLPQSRALRPSAPAL